MCERLAILGILIGVGIASAHAQTPQPTTPVKVPPGYLDSSGKRTVDPLGVFLVNPDGTYASSGSGSSTSAASTTTTPYLIGTATASPTVGTFVQVLAANSTRTGCTIMNTGTGVQTYRLNIGTDTAQPVNGAVSPFVVQINGIYKCGGYKGIVWMRSTVASDVAAYEDDR